jgi:hypothetical protein
VTAQTSATIRKIVRWRGVSGSGGVLNTSRYERVYA